MKDTFRQARVVRVSGNSAVGAACPTRRRSRIPQEPPFKMLPLVVLCGALIAVGMQFGSPVLWAAERVQPTEDSHATGVPLVPEQAVTDPHERLTEIGSYKAVSQSLNENRAVNIQLAAEALDGSVIEPGGSFSFNTRMGDIDHDERYLAAPVINGDEMIEGKGGGICQVSTALYIAALKANLTIKERHQHSIASDYAPIGLDATLVFGVMDLVIGNPTSTRVVIDAKATGQSVEVTLWGEPLPDGMMIDATSRIVERFERDGSGPPEDGFAVPHAGTYYVAESYRVFYQDGIKTSSVLLATDTYKVSRSETVTLNEGSVDPTK